MHPRKYPGKSNSFKLKKYLGKEIGILNGTCSSRMINIAPYDRAVPKPVRNYFLIRH